MTLPLHLSISEKLRQQIIEGLYQPGDMLPSEHQLISEFTVSRITVRRAIANLTQQGLVIVRQGKGTFVAAQQKVIYSLSNPLVFLEDDTAPQGIQIQVKTFVFEPVVAPLAVQEILQSSIAYLQKKVLLFNEIPGCVDITYILPELGEAYASELCQKMTFTTLAQHGISIEKIDTIIECTQANYETSVQLEVMLGHPLIVYRHTAYRGDNCPIVHGETLSRGDRFCYSIQVQRKNP
jgi:GntR family transcriptional regulator